MKDDTKKKVLIVRLSAIGDVIMATPLVGALKKTWPDCSVSWLVEKSAAPLLHHHPGLDEVIIWPRDEWRGMLREGRFIKLASSIRSFISGLRRRRFTIALDVQGLLKSGIWVFLTGAERRIGVGSREGSRFLMTDTIDRSGVKNRISSQYYLLAEVMGLVTEDFRMVLEVGDEEEKFAADFKTSLESTGYAVLCPFTTRPQKEWIARRFTETARWLIREKGLTVVVLGGPADAEEAGRILLESGPEAVNMAGRTTLLEAAGLIKHAALIIGVDTGLTHMGIALNVPTIALFGATAPYLNTQGTSGTVLYHPLDCSPCRRSPTCDGDYTCMKAISTDEVLSVADSLLEPEGRTS